ncbi:hypothetical protein MMC20_000718 [Loxospora ochrophaea]|nr:hypothetical protein [Loxospora ochrophaea]
MLPKVVKVPAASVSVPLNFKYPDDWALGQPVLMLQESQMPDGSPPQVLNKNRGTKDAHGDNYALIWAMFTGTSCRITQDPITQPPSNLLCMDYHLEWYIQNCSWEYIHKCNWADVDTHKWIPMMWKP